MASRRISPLQSSSTTAQTAQDGTLPPAATTAPTTSPWLPTLLELKLLLTYPITLLLGSIFSTVAPNIRTSKSTYSATHQSFQPQHDAPSYFAQKRNVFNVYFVKVGWFWATVTLLLFIFTHPSFGRPFAPQLSVRRLRVAVRWACMTLVWAATTQWFFGPPLIDRSFRLTGGSCERLHAMEEGEVRMGPIKEALTHAQCRVSGGTWSGGIDISGHVFLLILGSALLWMEILPAVLHSSGLREDRVVLMSDGSVQNAAFENEAEREKEKGEATRVGMKFAVGILALMWWMLLMTAAFFHTWVEKLSGLTVAFFGIWVVYFLPRGVPVVRAVLGMPGL